MKLKPSPPVVGPRRPGFNFFVANLYIVNMDASKNKPRGFREFVFKLKRSAWVRSTLSGLVGTTLGIILTFGTKTCADNVAKERTAATTTKMVMRHLNTTTNQYAKMAAEMERTDSIFKYIYDLYPDSLAYADKDKAHRFCNVFGSSGLYAGNESTEKIFNSMATWESIKDKEFIRQRVEESLRGAALWDEVKDKLNASAYALSGGQQQRLCIARAMAVSPSVLLMDEPASALDPISTAKVEELICELRKEVTIVIVTHNMQQASRVSDMTAFFYMGELVEYDDTKTIFTNPHEEATQNYITGRFG